MAKWNRLWRELAEPFTIVETHFRANPTPATRFQEYDVISDSKNAPLYARKLLR